MPDPNDRHVLAAAVRAAAGAIVTFNLKDFPRNTLEPLGIEATHPDTFLLSQYDLAPVRFLNVVRTHRAALKNPAKSPAEYIATLRRQRLERLADVLQASVEVI